MIKKYITHERIVSLQDSINWLSNYQNPSTEIHYVIGSKKELINKSLTKKLQRLGKINQERNFLIESLLKG